ncbi:hypothetical protein POX_b02069 [Penicillium oxalicum]|uniref:Uncharacterized protein n=1 Tax=Penicillium oxalicum (strain 114-2 / CGMCC 5302) TaxID=933388 RepID=S8AX79_PENO1|nr:hypothetical protein POX_b02069 [Penicillium oxalicum]EPS30938.1 hypothetical protein PDE_05892 [Penicillium oxalicum 114-2]KAI2792036.1 hypothetical protein POX_b02069 [Penicillium oxalicum]
MAKSPKGEKKKECSSSSKLFTNLRKVTPQSQGFIMFTLSSSLILVGDQAARTDSVSGQSPLRAVGCSNVSSFLTSRIIMIGHKAKGSRTFIAPSNPIVYPVDERFTGHVS